MIFQAIAKQYADAGCGKPVIWNAMHRGVESDSKIATYSFPCTLPNNHGCDLIHFMDGTGDLVPRTNVSSRILYPFGSHCVQDR